MGHVTPLTNRESALIIVPNEGEEGRVLKSIVTLIGQCCTMKRESITHSENGVCSTDAHAWCMQHRSVL